MNVGRADIFSPTPLRQIGGITDAHDRRPEARTAVIFLIVIAVVTEPHGVPDFMANRFGDILRVSISKRVRENVAILLAGSERPNVSDAAASVAGTADDDANRVRRGVEDGLIRSDGDVVSRVIFLNHKVDLTNEFKLFRREGRWIAVDVIRRVQFSAPTGIAFVETAKVEVNHVLSVRHAASNGEAVHFDGRVVDIDRAEFLVRVNRNARLRILDIPCIHGVENEALGRIRLVDNRTRESEAKRLAQIKRRSGKGTIEGQRVPQIAGTVFQASSAVDEGFLPVENVVDAGGVGDVGDVHTNVVEIEVLIAFVQVQGIFTQATVIGVARGGGVPFADARNADVISLTRFEFRSDKVREGGVDGIVDRLIPFLEFPIVVVDLAPKLVDDVEIVVGIAQNDRFAKGKLEDVAVLVKENDFAVFIEKFNLQVEVRVVVALRVILAAKDCVFRIRMEPSVPVEAGIDETMIRAVARDVDNVGPAVGGEGVNVVIFARFDVSDDVVRTRERIIFVRVDGDVVIFQLSGVVNRVARGVDAQAKVGG